MKKKWFVLVFILILVSGSLKYPLLYSRSDKDVETFFRYSRIVSNWGNPYNVMESQSPRRVFASPNHMPLVYTLGACLFWLGHREYGDWAFHFRLVSYLCDLGITLLKAWDDKLSLDSALSFFL